MLLVLLLAALADAFAADVPAVLASEMAVTVDNLPWVNGTRPGESTAQATGRLLGHLVERQVPAVGFVNCSRIAGHPACSTCGGPLASTSATTARATGAIPSRGR
jgi:hypothetical protein